MERKRPGSRIYQISAGSGTLSGMRTKRLEFLEVNTGETESACGPGAGYVLKVGSMEVEVRPGFEPEELLALLCVVQEAQK